MASAGSYAIPEEPSAGHSADVGEVEFGGNVEFGGAVVNVLNILSGVGLLSVPYALKKAGWAGLGVLWLLGIVTNYTGLYKCSQIPGKRTPSKVPPTPTPTPKERCLACKQTGWLLRDGRPLREAYS